MAERESLVCITKENKYHLIAKDTIWVKGSLWLRNKKEGWMQYSSPFFLNVLIVFLIKFPCMEYNEMAFSCLMDDHSKAFLMVSL